MTCLLMAGCGKAGEEGQLASMQESKSSEVSVEQSATTEENTGTSQEAGDQEDANQEATKPEEVPYVLTFETTTVDGETVTDACFGDSKLTMLNIWGTYCNPCLMEMPDLGEIAASYDKADFQMMGIVCDVPEGSDQADIDNAKALIEETGAHYPHLLLSESLYANLVGATDAVPTTFFVNQKGEVLGYIVGANTKDAWVELIEQLLAEA